MPFSREPCTPVCYRLEESTEHSPLVHPVGPELGVLAFAEEDALTDVVSEELPRESEDPGVEVREVVVVCEFVVEEDGLDCMSCGFSSMVDVL